MNCYEVLGISATDDVKVIRRAYAAKSREFHPEEHPQEFQILHDAYEEALARARQLKARSAEQGESQNEQPIQETETEETPLAQPMQDKEPEEMQEETSASEVTAGQWREQFERIASAQEYPQEVYAAVRAIMENARAVYMDEKERNRLYHWKDIFEEPQLADILGTRVFVQAWYDFLKSYHLFTLQIWQYFATQDGRRFSGEIYGIGRFPYEEYMRPLQEKMMPPKEAAKKEDHPQSGYRMVREEKLREEKPWEEKQPGRKRPLPIRILLGAAKVAVSFVAGSILGMIAGGLWG